MRLLAMLGTLVLSLSLAAGARADIHAQQPGDMQAADSAVQLEAVTEAADQSVVAASPVQGLPRRAPQPRTLHEFWPAFAVLAVLWIGMVLYIVPMGGPLRRIAERIAASENRTGGR